MLFRSLPHARARVLALPALAPALSALAPTHGLGRRPDLPFHSLCLPAPAPSLCLPLPLPLVLAAALLCRYALPAARALALSPYEYVLCIMYM